MRVLELSTMVAAVSGVALDPQNPKIADDEYSGRPPLLPSEKDNSNGGSNHSDDNSNRRKPKSRVVSSRYMSSPSTSSTSTSNSSSISSTSSSSSSFPAPRRFPSPLASRNSNPSSKTPSLAPKRSVSADRRRSTGSPAAARPFLPDLVPRSGNATEVSAATKLLVTSTRSLSVSFQGGAFSLPVSKTKVTPPSPNLSSLRRGTPERRRNITPSRGGGDHVENSKLSDQHQRWPARIRAFTSNPLSKSLDYSVEKNHNNLIGSGNGKPTLDLANSVINDLIISDSDSVSSDSTSGAQECAPNGPGLRRIAISAKFWQETNGRLRRLHDPSSPLSMSPGSKLIVPPMSKRYSGEGPLLSSPRRMSSPIRGAGRPASPGKLMVSSPLRAHSPSRIKNAVSTICNSFLETPSVLSFAVDVKRGKVGESRILDAHYLRLLYNRHLQWRFVNGRTEDVLCVQKQSAEKNLWNAWIAISDLRDTVTKKRHRLQLLRQKLKLASILRGQMRLLEDWASMEKDHSISLLGAIQALKASTLRLPVVGGAIANVQSLKDATGSALDVMQTMTSSICWLLPVVEEANSLVAELAKVAAKERALLEQCTYCISSLSAMQVHDSSLRTHIIQYYHLDNKRTYN